METVLLISVAINVVGVIGFIAYVKSTKKKIRSIGSGKKGSGSDHKQDDGRHDSIGR